MIKIDDAYSLYHNPPTADYPGGSAIDTPDDDGVEGTSWEALFFNDIEGFFQSIIVDGEGSFTVSGVPEKVGASDLLAALKKIIAARIAAIETPSAVLQKILSVDGAGSGLDADMLDGEHGSAFHNASNLNAGTLPAARMPAHTGDVTSSAGAVALTLVAASVLAKLLTVDGAGSSLDADLLDGEHGSAFHDASKITGTFPASAIPNLDAGKITSGTFGAARMPAFTGEATSSAGAVALTLNAASVKLKAWPVNSLYVQYADSAANAYDTAFPAANRPASLFGGTWSPQWEDSNYVFWRSGGTLAAEADRNNGLQSDAIRNITGKFGDLFGVIFGDQKVEASGAFSLTKNINSSHKTGDITIMQAAAIDINASRVVPTAAENRPINRRMIIWKRTA